MQPSYEEAFQRLEKIIEMMNTGKLPLEETLRLYEEADLLIQNCSSRLKETEERIEWLIKQRDGSLTKETVTSL